MKVLKSGLIFAAVILFTAMVPSLGFAGGDEIELRDGSSVRGNIVAQNAEQIYIDTKEKGLQKIDVSRIRTIHFGPVPVRNLPETPAPSPSPASR